MLINTIIGKTSNKLSVIDNLTIEGIQVHKKKTIANEFGKFFSSIGAKLAQKTDKAKKSSTSYLNDINSSNSSVFIYPTDKKEIIKLIGGLMNKNSCGPDGISNKLLKEIKHEISEPLTSLFNYSLEAGFFPECYKHSYVVPLFKSKSKSEKSNYRPISLLPTISKVLEKIMYRRTYRFLDKTNQLYISQYGFREDHSCEHAASELVSEIIKSKTEGLFTIAVFLDLSKAFDTLNHQILLRKLEIYGIRGRALSWYKNYIDGRKLQVKCQNENGANILSDQFSIEYGTPQGSCLGPLLFLIYTNDLYLHLENCNGILFADDTTIYKSHRNLNYLCYCIKTDLDTLSDWFKSNELTLNASKSECILFKPKGKKFANLPPINLGEIALPFVRFTKFLGLWIDDELTWKCQVDKIVSKLKSNTLLLQRGKNILTKHCKKLVYHSQIGSHLNYCLPLWGNMIDSICVEKLQKLQNKCFKIISGKNPTPKNFHELGLLRLGELIKLSNCKIMHKHLHGKLPKKISQALSTDSNNKHLGKSHKYMTRNKHTLNLPQTKNHQYHRSFLFNCIKDFDSLPVVTQKIDNLLLFVASCKRLLLE